MIKAEINMREIGVIDNGSSIKNYLNKLFMGGFELFLIR